MHTTQSQIFWICMFSSPSFLTVDCRWSADPLLEQTYGFLQNCLKWQKSVHQRGANNGNLNCAYTQQRLFGSGLVFADFFKRWDAGSFVPVMIGLPMWCWHIRTGHILCFPWGYGGGSVQDRRTLVMWGHMLSPNPSSVEEGCAPHPNLTFPFWGKA